MQTSKWITQHKGGTCCLNIVGCSDPEYEFVTILYHLWEDDPRKIDLCPIKMSLENVEGIWKKRWRAGHPEKPALPLSAAALQILLRSRQKTESYASTE